MKATVERNLSTTQNTNLPELTLPEMELIISPSLMSILTILVYYVLQIPVLICGICTNLMVMLTFIRCGLNDGITVSFFALSVSDFGYSTMFFIVRFSSMLQRAVDNPFYVRMDLLAYVISYYSVYFNDASVLTTVFTAVQKCCCVAIPHLFKNVFTPKRTWIVIVVMNCGLLCIFVPMLQSLRLQPTFLPFINETQVYLHVHPLFYDVLPVWEVFSRIVLPISAECIILVCLLIMSYRLRQSAKFRNRSANQNDLNVSTKTNEANRLGPKETRALAAVTVVSGLFFVAMLPATTLYVFQTINPVLDEPRQLNVRSLVRNSQNILVHVNAAVNLLVYLRFNTKFKGTFKELFKMCSAKQSN